jgi:hypothetical protein
MNLSQNCCSRIFFRDVDGCVDKFEGVMPALMSVTFTHFYLGITLIFGENEN